MITKRIAPSGRQAGRLALVIIFGLTAAVHAKAYEATAEQRAACTPDAFRLCFSAIPNVDAVKSCMIANKAKLSAGCLATFPKETARR
ncbi:MAG: hypothetical protein ACLPID_19410 [Beijerinckiaceae bacterium]